MRVAFLGNAAWSVPSLEALAASGHQVSLVVTRTPRPAGRGHRTAPTPVGQASARLGLPLAQVDTVRSGPGFEVLAASRPDILAVVAYGEILPQAVLDLPGTAPVNVHFSLLPELRGAAPVQRALMQGRTVSGVTTIWMDAGIDTGPILLQASEGVLPQDDAGSLGARLAAVGGRLLVETIDGLSAGTLLPRPQDEALSTTAPKLRPDERMLEWARPAEEVVNLVRAMAPEPGAATRYRGRGLKVLRAAVATGALHAEPGEVVLASEEGLAVAVAGGEAALLLDVQPESRRRMSGPEFIRGYGPRVGERLG